MALAQVLRQPAAQRAQVDLGQWRWGPAVVRHAVLVAEVRPVLEPVVLVAQMLQLRKCKAKRLAVQAARLAELGDVGLRARLARVWFLRVRALRINRGPQLKRRRERPNEAGR